MGDKRSITNFEVRYFEMKYFWMIRRQVITLILENVSVLFECHLNRKVLRLSSRSTCFSLDVCMHTQEKEKEKEFEGRGKLNEGRNEQLIK